MHQYKIYHLEHDILSKMLIHGPRSQDKALREYEESVIKAFSLLTDRKRMRENPEDQVAWQHVAKGASYLWRHHWFVPVASLLADSGMLAIRKTTSINIPWYVTKDKKIELYCDRNHRSTAYLDIVEVMGKRHLYLWGGFFDIDTAQFIEPITEVAA